MTDEELFIEIESHCSGMLRGVAIDKRMNEFIDAMENGANLDRALDNVAERFSEYLIYDGKPYDIRVPIRSWWTQKMTEHLSQESGG
jgi:hypothetical protein